MRSRPLCAAILIATGLTAGMALAGCGHEDETPALTGDQPSPSTSISSPHAGTPTTSAAGMVTVTGAVITGVEAGCLLVKAEGREYLLVGGDRSKMRVGEEITVKGQIDPDALTTCMQGTPLKVSEITSK